MSIEIKLLASWIRGWCGHKAISGGMWGVAAEGDTCQETANIEHHHRVDVLNHARLGQPSPHLQSSACPVREHR